MAQARRKGAIPALSRARPPPGAVPLLLAALALTASSAYGQQNLRATETQERSITVAWDGEPQPGGRLDARNNVTGYVAQLTPTVIANQVGTGLCTSIGPTNFSCPNSWTVWQDQLASLGWAGGFNLKPGRTYRITIAFGHDPGAAAGGWRETGRVSGDFTTAGELVPDPVTDDEDEDDDGGDDGNGGDGGGGGPPPGGGGGGGGPPPPDDDDQDDEPPPPPPLPPEAEIAVDAACAGGLCRARAGVAVRFDDASAGLVRFRRWDFGDGTERTSRAVSHSWSEPGFYTVTLRVGDGETESTASRLFLVEASDPAGTCEASARTRCLLDSRFSVEVEWRTAEGASGAGGAVREGTNDSALFHFFESGNWEILVKVLDGCALNGHVWVFGASATTLGWELRVTDTVTGAERVYGAEPGERAPAVTDARAFPGSCEG